MKVYLVKRAGEILKRIDVYGVHPASISRKLVLEFYSDRTGLSVDALIKLGVGVEEAEPTEWSEHEVTETEADNSSQLN